MWDTEKKIAPRSVCIFQQMKNAASVPGTVLVPANITVDKALSLLFYSLYVEESNK